MRVHFITSSYPRHEHDHAGSFVEAQVRHLAALGVRPEVFCWADKLRASLDSDWPVHRVAYAPADAQYLFYGSGAPETLARYPAMGLMAVPAMAAMFARLMMAPAPDLYVGHWFVPGGVIARLVGRLRGVPSVVIGHSGGVQLLNRMPAGTQLTRLIADGVCTVTSDPLREMVVAAAPNAGVRVMPMGIDLPRHEPEGERSGALFLGRLEPIKGVEVAIDSTLAAGVPLQIGGDGSLRQVVEKSHARFEGFLSGDDKWAAIDRAEVSLHPSVPQSGRHEGLPVSLLECAARGTFPFVSGTPGIERWLAEPARQVCRAERVEDFVEALKWWRDLLPEKKKRLAEAQRAKVEPLEWTNWAAEWRTLFEQALS